MADDPPEPTADAEPGTEYAVVSDEQLEQVDELLEGLWSGQVVYSGVKLGVFEVVSHDPVATETVAEELGADPEYLYRLLRALAHYEVLEPHGDRQFSITEVGTVFQEDHPESLVNGVLLGHSPEFLSALTHLHDVVREGGPSGFVREFGCNSFEYAEENPEYATVFNRAMTNQSRGTTPEVLDALADYDFDGIEHVCDVGGGYGHTLCRLLDAHPHLEGTVLDLPNVVEEDGEHWAPEVGVTDRCTYVPGDMFDAVPRADAYVLKFILHDWHDDDCAAILSTIRDAAPPDCRLFVVESLLTDSDYDDERIAGDIGMMVLHDGRERTEAEYRSLFDRAGWTFVRTWAPDEEVSVVEARRA